MSFRWFSLRKIVKTGLVLGLLGTAMASSVVVYLVPSLPPIDELRDVKLQTPLRVYAQEGALIGEFGEQKRNPVTFRDIPDAFVKALLAAEDDNFFNHYGVDLFGLLRAGTQLITTRRIQSGGSTITMQVARNFFLSRKQTFTRKFNEILLSFEIEHELSKAQILELYANKVYLGKRAYGVQAAANVYYGKNISELSLAELAMIAGLPKAPSLNNPINNPERALARRNWILRRMASLDYISEEQSVEAIEQPLTASARQTVIDVDAPYLAEMVRREMLERYGEDAYEDGYTVVTTVDAEMQRAASRAVQVGLMTYDRRHGYRGAEGTADPALLDSPVQLDEFLNDIPDVGPLVPAVVVQVHDKSAELRVKRRGLVTLDWDDGLSTARPYKTESWRGPEPSAAKEVLSPGDLVRVRARNDQGALDHNAEQHWVLSQVPRAQAAMVALDPSNGAIKALHGGFDFFHNRFNRIISAKRQPGSNLKPFLYTVALEEGFTPATTVNDAPIVFDDAALEDIWRPENDSGKFYGPTRLREALYFSRNLVSIRILREIGLRRARQQMQRFGFAENQLAPNLTLALGSEALPPLKIAEGYTAFANGGYKVAPYLISEIYDRDDNLIYQANPAIAPDIGATGSPSLQLQQQYADQSDQLNNTEQNTIVASSAADLLWTAGDQSEISENAADTPPVMAERIIEPRVHYLIDSILRDVIVRGTGRRARVLERADIAGKTGTTNGPRDAWFSGYSPHLVATAWLGFDDNSLLGSGEFGGTAALPIWIDFMAEALKGKPEITFEQPAGLVAARINPDTGLPASPDDQNAIFEYFLKENSPPALESSSSNVGTDNAAGVNETDSIF